MTTNKRPIHRGISNFALWALVQSRSPVTLAGRKVIIHEAKPSLSQGEGWYNALVSDEHSTSTYYMDVTTSEYEERRQHIADHKKRRKIERKKQQI